MPQSFEPYDAESFRSLGHALVDRLAEHLAACGAARPGDADAAPVLSIVAPAELEAEWSAALEAAPGGEPAERALALVDALLERSNHLHHPGYVGHQIAPPLPTAALFELVGGLLNNGMAVYEMGQLQTVLERRCLEWFAERIGFPESSGGLLTSGGSLGNLTALLAARQAQTGSWETGSHDGPPLAVMVSADSHYCIARAVQVMGWGAEGIVRVPVDADHRMRTDLLPELHDAATAKGKRVIAVVASSCSTATGAFDDLEAIADFCEARELWLHVDGAHGASHALSAKHRDVLRGVERADSVVWDAHKLALVPALITAVLFRDARHAARTFAQEASYLFEDDMAAYDVGHRTLECTKRALGATLYAALHAHGTQVFTDNVDRLVDLAQDFARLLERSTDFELAVQPRTNIVCFRHVPAGFDGDLDALQERLRRALVDSGAFYLVQTRLAEGQFLRTTLMNPQTSIEDLVALLEALRSVNPAIGT